MYLQDNFFVARDHTTKNLYFLAGTLFRTNPSSGEVKRFRYASDAFPKESFTEEFIEKTKQEFILHLEERLKK